MDIKYFQDTDTLLINFNNNQIVDTQNINENVLAEFDEKGQLVSMTIEYAREQADIMGFSYQQVAA
ncbi:DUF2283 domain-containing protein [Candidatus Albibeggiatoa sp. nov. BB20]|uniref:DUF2283 domain-containing protein n=1 Tax=Candidatus Albibeggiatoa sp. nov. BB20 TaxID=3162723 RepID=UPI003365B060